MATRIVTNDTAGASSNRQRRAAANTGAVKVQIVKASVCPASATAMVIAEAIAMAEARASIRRRKAWRWKMHDEAWRKQAGK
eukprot:6015935-Pleurochrysis_carterae.AAC.1